MFALKIMRIIILYATHLCTIFFGAESGATVTSKLANVSVSNCLFPSTFCGKSGQFGQDVITLPQTHYNRLQGSPSIIVHPNLR